MKVNVKSEQGGIRNILEGKNEELGGEFELPDIKELTQFTTMMVQQLVTGPMLEEIKKGNAVKFLDKFTLTPMLPDAVSSDNTAAGKPEDAGVPSAEMADRFQKAFTAAWNVAFSTKQ